MKTPRRTIGLGFILGVSVFVSVLVSAMVDRTMKVDSRVWTLSSEESLGSKFVPLTEFKGSVFATNRLSSFFLSFFFSRFGSSKRRKRKNNAGSYGPDQILLGSSID